MDEAENVCCAPSASISEALQTLIQCMRAAAPLEGAIQTAKRSVTRVIDQADDQYQLDPHARLEKREVRQVPQCIRPNKNGENLQLLRMRRSRNSFLAGLTCLPPIG